MGQIKPPKWAKPSCQKHYSLDDTDANVTTIFHALNEAIATAAARERLPIADVFTAFQNAAMVAGGHACNAGLLNASPQNQFVCDIHPSQSGQALIARTIAQTLIRMRGRTR